MNQQEAQLNHFFRLVSDETRLKVLGIVANEPQTIAELAKMLNEKPKRIQGHLEMLIREQLVERERDGNSNRYRLNASQLERLRRQIEVGELAEPAAPSALERYVQNGRLTAMPYQPAAQEEVLNWLSEKFEINQRYTTVEMESILNSYCDRPLTALRFLRDRRLLLTNQRHLLAS